MSLWQRPHVALVMKKFDGIVPPTFVRADEGKNGLEGPSPSPSIVGGGSSGLTMRERVSHWRFAVALTTIGMTITRHANAMPAFASARLPRCSVRDAYPSSHAASNS